MSRLLHQEQAARLNLPNSAAALHTVLSQLSFEADVMPDGMIENTGSIWDGLFCFSFDENDQDLFFDAEDHPRSEGSSGSSSFDPSKVRGGHNNKNNSSNDPSSSSKAVFQPTGPIIMETTTPESAENGENTPASDSLSRESFKPLPPPSPPEDLPDRFLRAGKGDPVEGQRRYEATLKWRKENGIDHILTDPHPHFELIKKHYPHFYHLRGRNGEPVFFEQPPKTNLSAMRGGGVDLDGLLRHYAMVSEFQWQCIDRDDNARSITILDLEGMRMMDFVGECVEYVRKCSEFTGQHYPERAGFVFVINVPAWFSMIWKVVKPMVDEVTLKKINILRGKKEISDALLEKIPIENIPPEYGGKSVPLGESPEEQLLKDMIRHNNALANGDFSCGGRDADPPCQFCSFRPARSY